MWSGVVMSIALQGFCWSGRLECAELLSGVPLWIRGMAYRQESAQNKYDISDIRRQIVFTSR